MLSLACYTVPALQQIAPALSPLLQKCSLSGVWQRQYSTAELQVRPCGLRTDLIMTANVMPGCQQGEVGVVMCSLLQLPSAMSACRQAVCVLMHVVRRFLLTGLQDLAQLTVSMSLLCAAGASRAIVLTQRGRECGELVSQQCQECNRQAAAA